jgi:hypothetical protein
MMPLSRIVEDLEEFDEFAAAMTVPDQGMNLAAEKVDAGQQAHRAVAFVFKLACDAASNAPWSKARWLRSTIARVPVGNRRLRSKPRLGWYRWRAGKRKT